MRYFLLSTLLVMSATSFAYTCPELKLECDQIKFLPERSEKVLTLTSEFKAINDDEPSLPPNQCQAYLSFQIQSSKATMNVSVDENLETYMYIFEAQGAQDPQFSLKAQPNQEFQMYYKSTRLVCRLK